MARVTASHAALLACVCVLLLAVPTSAFSPAFRAERNFEQVAAESAEDGKPNPLTLGPGAGDCTTDHSSTVWMCISTVLVLGMSPALALFEAGMLRSKNTVSLITQVFAGIITLSVLWVCIGFSLTFGESQGGFIGNLDHAFFIDVSYSDCSTHAPQIPEALFAMFQMMFAVITPLLMTGAFAERLKFKVYMAFIVLWEILVYYPLAHWIWGGGFLGKWGTLDFAGGIVIHASAGTGSLLMALYLGRRKHFFDFMGEWPPSNLPLAATGGALLWMGWFGFNGGSALASGPLAVSAIVSSQVGCSSGAITWLVLSWWKEKPQTTALLNGALAGLAGITPASGYINTPASICLGAVFGIASFAGVHCMKHHWHIDDALDVSTVHGLTGVLGALGLGLFAQLRMDPLGANGAFYGHPMQLVYQLVGVLLAIGWAGFWTIALLKMLDKFAGGVRVGEDEEEVGLDWAEHHEIAYHKLHVLDDASVAEQPLYHHMDPEEELVHSSVGANSSMLDRSLLDSSPISTVNLQSSGNSQQVVRSTAVTRMAMPTTHTYRRSATPHGDRSESPAPMANM